MGQEGLSLLPQVMQPYGQASGAYSNPAAASQAVQAAMMPMAVGELAKSGAIGYGLNSIFQGKQPTAMQQVFGGQQSNSTLWDIIGSLGKGVIGAI